MLLGRGEPQIRGGRAVAGQGCVSQTHGVDRVVQPEARCAGANGSPRRDEVAERRTDARSGGIPPESPRLFKQIRVVLALAEEEVQLAQPPVDVAFDLRGVGPRWQPAQIVSRRAELRDRGRELRAGRLAVVAQAVALLDNGIETAESRVHVSGPVLAHQHRRHGHRRRDHRDPDHGGRPPQPRPRPQDPHHPRQRSGPPHRDRPPIELTAQVGRHVRRRGVAILRPLLQRLVDDRLHIAVQRGGVLSERARLDGGDLQQRARRGETPQIVGDLSGEQLVGDDAERVDVAAVVDLRRPAGRLLGAHVADRAEQLPRLGGDGARGCRRRRSAARCRSRAPSVARRV